MGFNNDGAAAAARRLARRAARHRRHQHRQDQARLRGRGARRLHRAAPKRLAPLADYLVVNVSSPNTPGLRDLQAVDKLRPLLPRVRAACDLASPMRRVPLLVKIAPDLADADIDAIADLALELGLDGIIATNTTIARTGLATPERRGHRARRRRPLRRAAQGALARRCCAACARASARALIARSRSAASRPPTTRGPASAPAPRSCRPTPASSTAGRCGRAGCSASSPRACAPPACRSIEQAIGADAYLDAGAAVALTICLRSGRACTVSALGHAPVQLEHALLPFTVSEQMIPQ